MKLLKISTLLCCVAFMAACGNKPKASYANIKLVDFFELKMGNSAVMPESKFKLTFTGVSEDSRCPKFVNCIQEGQVKLVLNVSIDGKSQPVELVRKPSDQGPTVATVGKYKLQLYDVMPYPENGKKINPADYSARMMVKEASAPKQ